MSKPQPTISKRELNNLRIMARIVRRIYHNPFCYITFISKDDEIPKNIATVRNFLNKLLDTSYFKSTFLWNKECFYINKFPDPSYLSQRTFLIKKHEMSMFFNSREYLSETNTYKEFTSNLGAKSIIKLAKADFKKKRLVYNNDLNLNQDICEQIFRKLLCIYHIKMLVYIRDEDYELRKARTYVKININARMEDVTRFILNHIEEFAKKISQYNESEFLKYAQNITPILDMEYETTSTHLINSTEYLTTISNKSKLKRKVRTLTERIEFWQLYLDAYFDPENPRNVPNWMMRVLRPIMKDDGTPDFAKMTLIDAMESGCDVLFAENYKIEEFLQQWMEKHPLEIEIK
ncbi:MAG: hypothetical protein IIC67_02040 [Thaumarchaeota archaeon]|nr:hypothetical protein [Nitrososphaerota archaeon]